jgi:hypothetical protein
MNPDMPNCFRRESREQISGSLIEPGMTSRAIAPLLIPPQRPYDKHDQAKHE